MVKLNFPLPNPQAFSWSNAIYSHDSDPSPGCTTELEATGKKGASSSCGLRSSASEKQRKETLFVFNDLSVVHIYHNNSTTEPRLMAMLAVLGPLHVAWPLKVASTESTHASCFRPNVAVLQCQANAWRVCELSANATCTYIMYSHLIQERKHLEEGDLNRKTSLLKGPCPNPIAWCFLDVLLKSDNQRVESSSLHSVLCHQFSISQPTKCSWRVS